MKHSDPEVTFIEDWRHGGFGLYVHWPYCLAKCPYCDFNSHVAAQVDHAAWSKAFAVDLERVGRLLPGRILTSIYFGGGTPSLMPPDLTGQIIDDARRLWGVANDLEVTLEANPTSVEAGKLRDFRSVGVNRVSMGLQALNDTDLRRLGRMHSAEEGRAAFDLACTIFDRVSFDLIYARQFQGLDDWRKELREALAMQHGHLSMYQLTIEDGTVFGRRHAQGQLKGLPNDDLGADFYDLTQEMAETAGLPAYEVSNHAAPCQESRHNLVYWNSGDYAGIGPGAHGRLTLAGQRHTTAAVKSPGDWLTQALSDQETILGETIGREEQAVEFLLMGLRLRDGIDPRRFAAIAGAPLNPQVLAELVDLGMLSVEDHTIKTTPKGRPVLNAVLLKLIETL